jgi:hypothetical protein
MSHAPLALATVGRPDAVRRAADEAVARAEQLRSPWAVSMARATPEYLGESLERFGNPNLLPTEVRPNSSSYSWVDP